MTPADISFAEACEAWDSAAQEGRLYGREDACPGLSVREDPTWRAWRNYQGNWTALWESERGEKGPAAPYGCPSRTGEYPWQDCIPQVVAVVGGAGDCSGVLVAPDVVLTAGHCSDACDVLASDIVKTGSAPEFRTQRRITRVITHSELDVALVALDERLPFDPVIWPVAPTPLPESVLVYGFGESSAGAGDFGTLLGSWFLGEQIVPCPGPGTARLGCHRKEEFILTNPGRDSAPGDSGAPVLEQLGDGWRLVGVTSRSLLGGGTGDGGTYTRVDAISHWLISSIHKLAHP